MTENAETQTEKSKKPRSMASLALWALMAVAAIGGGFATPFLLDPPKAGADEKETSTAETDAPPALIEFGEVTVNLNESRLNRYLRLKISLLVSESFEAQVSEAMIANQPVLKNWLLSYLSDKGMDDIRGAPGQNRLRREIQMQFNSVMFPGEAPLIQQVLFQEFNVQ